MLSSRTLHRLRIEPLEQRQLMDGSGVGEALVCNSPLLDEGVSDEILVASISNLVGQLDGDAVRQSQNQPSHVEPINRPHAENSTLTERQDDATGTTDSVFESWNESADME